MEKITFSNISPKNPEKKINQREAEEERYTKEEVKKISRRSFLKGASIAGAGGVVSHIENKGKKVERIFNIIDKTFKKFRDSKQESKTEKKEETDLGFDDEEILEETENEMKKSIDKPKTTNFEIKKIGDYYLKAFHELKMKEEFFPHKIFTRNLLIAQQLQESGYKANAISKANAIGVMQNMDISIADVSLFLEKLNNEGIIEYNGPIYIGNLEKERKILQNKLDKKSYKSKEKIKWAQSRITQIDKKIKRKKEKFGNRILKGSDLLALVLQRVDNPDYSKALGKLYLMRLYNKPYGYGAGQKQYQKGDIKGAQMEILGAYNAGYGRVKNKPIDRWLEEPRTYVNRIFNYIHRLENIREAMAKAGLDEDNDSITMRIAREMNKVRGHGNQRTKMLEKTMNFIIEIIKKEQENKGRELNDQEIIKIFSKLQNTKDTTSEQFYTQI